MGLGWKNFMLLKESQVPREVPGNLGSRKHLILIRTKGSGREEQTILKAGGGRLVFLWGEGRILNYNFVGKAKTEKIINDQFFYVLKPTGSSVCILDHIVQKNL